LFPTTWFSYNLDVIFFFTMWFSYNLDVIIKKNHSSCDVHVNFQIVIFSQLKWDWFSFHGFYYNVYMTFSHCYCYICSVYKIFLKYDCDFFKLKMWFFYNVEIIFYYMYMWFFCNWCDNSCDSNTSLICCTLRGIGVKKVWGRAKYIIINL
jgi:hypothetical protein